MRMIRFGKRGEVIQHYSPLDRDSTSSRAKRDFWLPSGFWWPKDSRHQRFKDNVILNLEQCWDKILLKI